LIKGPSTDLRPQGTRRSRSRGSQGATRQGEALFQSRSTACILDGSHHGTLQTSCSPAFNGTIGTFQRPADYLVKGTSLLPVDGFQDLLSRRQLTSLLLVRHACYQGKPLSTSDFCSGCLKWGKQQMRSSSPSDQRARHSCKATKAPGEVLYGSRSAAYFSNDHHDT